MKTLIPEDLTGKALFEFLVANKKSLLQEKKSRIKTGLTTTLAATLLLPADVSGLATKAGTATGLPVLPAEDTGVVRVKFVANTANWMDSQADVLLPGCWAKSIQEGKGKLHVKNHSYNIEDEVGDVQAIYESAVSLRELGVNADGTASCLVYESDVRKEYDERTYKRYRAGKQNQHSIGMQYVKMEMAINDSGEYFKDEYATWQRYISQIINSDEVEKQGYFFAVSEIRLIEASAVLLGSNQLTRTLEETTSDTTEKQPDNTSTVKQPAESEKGPSFADFLSSKSLL